MSRIVKRNQSKPLQTPEKLIPTCKRSGMLPDILVMLLLLVPHKPLRLTIFKYIFLFFFFCCQPQLVSRVLVCELSECDVIRWLTCSSYFPPAVLFSLITLWGGRGLTTPIVKNINTPLSVYLSLMLPVTLLLKCVAWCSVCGWQLCQQAFIYSFFFLSW